MCRFLPVNEPPHDPTARFPIRLVAARAGLTPHVLRAWERRYGVVAPSRSDGGQRLYSLRDIERLSRLRRLTDRGHSIGRLAALGPDELARLEEESGPEATAKPRLHAPSARGPAAGNGDIPAALRAIRGLDAPELHSILARAAVSMGVPEFLDGVMTPVLEEIGQGWTERSVSIAQEHMATAVFRRVLGWLLDVYALEGAAPRLVVATLPGQAHELGALMAAVSAAAEGWAVTYLGPDLPVADLVSAATQTGARAVAVSIVCAPDERAVAAALREARASLPAQVPLLLGGAAASAIALERDSAGVVVLDSLAGLRVLLREMGEADAA